MSDYVYGLNKSGMSVIKLLNSQKKIFDCWDDNKKIRHLEIEIDYIENKEPENFVYLRKLNKELDELYSNLETLESENETN